MTAVTPGQALHDSLRESATTTFGLLVSDFADWDQVPQWQRDRLEDAGKAAVEAARLRQPEACAGSCRASDAAETILRDNQRLRQLIGELLDSTGLDDAERARWLETAGLDDDGQDEPEELDDDIDNTIPDTERGDL